MNFRSESQIITSVKTFGNIEDTSFDSQSENIEYKEISFKLKRVCVRRKDEQKGTGKDFMITNKRTVSHNIVRVPCHLENISQYTIYLEIRSKLFN